ncbi:MAG: isoleucine--tRNA ligase [Candidatus Marinimicrobia bacterium]|nr:isoleucine--tRNA ligase [Candidatus Neomarinimicrobiota bacterium]
MSKGKFKEIKNKVDFISLEHEVLDQWKSDDTFNKLREKNKGNKPWSFLDGPITANNPMGVHHAWGRTLKDVFQRYHAMQGYDLRYQNGFDCQGLWVEVEVEKELGFKSKRDIIDFGIEKFVQLCKDRVKKYSKIQTEQSIRLGYWMDWDNSYYTMSDENNYTIWSFLKKLYDKGKIYRGTDVVPWSGRSGTSYSQMEIIEGRKLVAHNAIFIKFPLKDRKNENLLIWTTTPWTLTSNIAAAVNVDLEYLKVKMNDESIYYFAKDNYLFQRLEKQFSDKKQWIDGVPKLKTLEQIFKERGGCTIVDTIKGSDMLGWEYYGPFDELDAQSSFGGYPFINDNLKDKKINALSCHRVIDGGKDNIGNDIVVSGEGTGIVHIATGCGAIDNKIGKKLDLVELAPLNDESKYIDSFGWLTGKTATDPITTEQILDNLKDKGILFHVEKYPHVYPHCWRSGDELVYRTVDEWYINMDWRDSIKRHVDKINWIPDWGSDREKEWLENMGDWMISKKRFWGLALPIWTFDDGSYYVVGSREELKDLAVEGWEDFRDKSPHKPWIDKVKIKHPETGLIGSRIPDVGNPWLDAGIVPYSTLQYNTNKNYWKEWFPVDFVVECFPGQFRNWFYSLLAMSTIMEDKSPFKTLLGHALVKDETGRDMHKSWGNAIWFDDAAEKMGVDTMRWLYASQNTEHNLLFGYKIADEVRKNLITLWNTYSFFTTYANLDNFNPSLSDIENCELTDIDKWILAKMNNFIKQSKILYESFELYKLMKYSVEILDDISNWYIRRNRRRFWKSENDDDKLSAYHTLYSVLLDYIKVMSPVIPFISEKIYQNLVCEIFDNAPQSIHLSDFPKYNEKFENEKLIADIDTVKNIVNLGRSIRNKANIKIRQPLNNIKIFIKDKDISLDKYDKQILDELNIKNIEYIHKANEIVSYDVKLNFGVLNKDYNKIKSDIINTFNSANKIEVLESLNENKCFEINDSITLSEDCFIINEIASKGYCVSSNREVIASINVELNDNLINEGMVRDLIRKIQNLRKDSNFKVDDRINIGLVSDKKLYNAVQFNEEYFLNEVLGVNLILDKCDNDFVVDSMINDIKVKLGISKNNK